MQVKPQQVPFLGVLIGAMTLMGIGQMLIQPLPSRAMASLPTSQNPDREDEESLIRRPTPEELILRRYAAVCQNLRHGRVEEATAQLRALHNLSAPLRSDLDVPGSTTPGTLYFRVTEALAEQAQVADQAGDHQASRRWLQECRALRDRILADEHPTAETVLVARMIHKRTLRSAADLGISWKEDVSRHHDLAHLGPAQLSML